MHPTQTPKASLLTTQDRGTKDSCLKVAQKIAGASPPSWLVRYFEESILDLAAHRLVDSKRLKRGLKNRLINTSKLFESLKQQLNDPITVALLQEKQYRAQQAVVDAHVREIIASGSHDRAKASEFSSKFSEVTVFSAELEDLLRALNKFIFYADFTTNLPELSGAGRNRVYLRGNVPPKQLCAFIIWTARRHFGCSAPTGREAFDCAETFWAGSRTALGSNKTIPNEPSKTVTDKLGHWRPYFDRQKEKSHFAAFEGCRVGLAQAAFLSERRMRDAPN